MKIIAELGSNWKTVNDLLKAPQHAKDCGADAIKYQYFTSQELYGKDIPSINKYHVHLDWLKEIKEICDNIDIEFMCTGFSWRGYNQLDHLVKCHKVASSESSWTDLIFDLRIFNKPVYLSTGGLSMTKIKYIVENWSRTDGPDLTLMYCDPHYPSNLDWQQINNGILRLADYGVDVGYSDHTDYIEFDDCVLHGLSYSSVYEKHFNPYGYNDTPDWGHSLNKKQFDQFVTNLIHIDTHVSCNTENPHMRVKTEKGWHRPYLK